MYVSKDVQQTTYMRLQHILRMHQLSHVPYQKKQLFGKLQTWYQQQHHTLVERVQPTKINEVSV